MSEWAGRGLVRKHLTGRDDHNGKGHGARGFLHGNLCPGPHGGLPRLCPRRVAVEGQEDASEWREGKVGGSGHNCISVIKGRGAANGNEKKKETSRWQVFPRQLSFRGHSCFITGVLES